LTSFYSWRLIFMTFHGKPRASADVMSHVHESPPVMTVPLAFWPSGALFAGIVFEQFRRRPLVQKSSGRARIFAGLQNPTRSWTDSTMCPMGRVRSPVRDDDDSASLLAYWMYIRKSASTPKALAARHDILYRFLLNKWYFDELYDAIFVARPVARPVPLEARRRLAHRRHSAPTALPRASSMSPAASCRLQTGFVYHYAFAMLIGVAALITYRCLCVRRLMLDWPILSIVTFLPLVGLVALILF
jgi:NADH-quinone oxidoreductase subunit L